MAHWSVIGTGKEGDLQGKSFAVTLITETLRWVADGPSVDKFFAARSGVFIGIVVPDKGTALRTDGGVEVAFFRNLTVDSAIGATGSGRASEKGANFDWKLDTK